MKKSSLFTIVLLTFLTKLGLSQSIYSKGIESLDSLNGFDESAAIRSAISENFLGPELKIKLKRLKREFIDKKYGIKNSQEFRSYEVDLNHRKLAAQTVCNNEDFEASTLGSLTSSNSISGWIIDEGYNGLLSPTSTSSLLTYFPGGLLNPNSCNLTGCCPMPPINCEIIDCSSPGGYYDPNLGLNYPIFSIFGTGTVTGSGTYNSHIPFTLGGTKVLRLNNTINDYSVARLSKSILVNKQNCLFQFAFVSVLSGIHDCCDAGSLQISFKDTLNSIQSCPSHSFVTASTQCSISTSFSFNTGGLASFNRWNVNYLDLSQHIGQTITMEVIVTDCNAGGHLGYTYFDAQCGSMDISINEKNFSVADSMIRYISCKQTNTLSANNPALNYIWRTPTGYTTTSNNIITSNPGVYTLTIGQGQFCTPIIKTVSIIHLSNSSSLNSTDSVLCKGNTAVLNALGVNSCTWSTGQTSQIIFVSPSVTTSYSINGIDTNGCAFTSKITQIVDECVGFIELNEQISEIRITPNPNKGDFEITILKSSSHSEFILYNDQGNKVHQQAVVKGRNTISTIGLSSGLYYYFLLEDNGDASSGKVKIE